MSLFKSKQTELQTANVELTSQLEALQLVLDDKDAAIEGFDTKIADLESEVAQLSTSNTELTVQTETLTSDLSDAKQAVTDFELKVSNAVTEDLAEIGVEPIEEVNEDEIISVKDQFSAMTPAEQLAFFQANQKELTK
tara:strand:+ start:1153 stop:1566 length:414 start_codon:yes stop_codon:yes gene_type:complete